MPAPLERLVLEAVKRTERLSVPGKRRHVTAAYGRCIDKGWLEFAATPLGIRITRKGHRALKRTA